MADAPKHDGLPEGTQPKPPTPKPRNPAFRMMGLPNFRFRLPSRNWMIFLTVTGSIAAAITYDRREKKKAQKKWCDLVAHIAQEHLPVNQMPRKLTIYLSAAPGDGIRPSRDYFREYIKPVLVAAAMDYDVIEGRKQGDVRHGTAERIRRLRRKTGEKGGKDAEEEMDTAQAIEAIREKMQVSQEPVLQGDLVLGRHTWKEYIRGLHEGWLGPLEEPGVPAPEPLDPPATAEATSESLTAPKAEGEQKPEEEKKSEEEKKAEDEKKSPFPPPSYLSTTSYSLSPISPHIPQLLEPSAPIHQQHLLGFLKTPQRIYHFLTRRHLADQLGRETAAIVLAFNRPYQQSESFATPNAHTDDLDAAPTATRAPESDLHTSDPAVRTMVQMSQAWEQQSVLEAEEAMWHKSVRKPRKEGDESEHLWTDKVVMDPRIAERMRKFELAPEEEERAARIASGLEKGRALPVENVRANPILLGNLDQE